MSRPIVIDSLDLVVENRDQLFVDNWLIEQADSVTRRWHRPERLGEAPAIVADQPWEHTPYFTFSNFTVIHDPQDGKFKVWYEDLGPMEPFQTHPKKARLLYAESEDGITFTKPLVGVEVDGRKTNIVAGYVEGAVPTAQNPWADYGVHSAGIVLDPTSTERRFKMLFSRSSLTGEEDLATCAYSPDGVTWTEYDTRPSYGGSQRTLGDVSILDFDEDSRMFVHYTRDARMISTSIPADAPIVSPEGHGFFTTYFPHRPDLFNKRRVWRSVSADFLNWSPLIPIAAPDDTRDNLDEAHYCLRGFRVGGMYFGFLGVIHYVDNTNSVRLVYSRDGISWHDTNNARPIFEPRGDGHWDRFMISLTSAPVRVGDTWFIHHGGSAAHHDFWMSGKEHLDHAEAADPAAHVRFGMGVATMRYNGLVSLEAKAPRGGQIVTRALKFDGPRLSINARVRPGGSIRVALMDNTGAYLPGRGPDDAVPFDGDSVEHILQWKDGDQVSEPDIGKGYIKLHILIQDAEIFAFGGRP